MKTKNQIVDTILFSYPGKFIFSVSWVLEFRPQEHSNLGIMHIQISTLIYSYLSLGLHAILWLLWLGLSYAMSPPSSNGKTSRKMGMLQLWFGAAAGFKQWHILAQYQDSSSEDCKGRRNCQVSPNPTPAFASTYGSIAW